MTFTRKLSSLKKMETEKGSLNNYDKLEQRAMELHKDKTFMNLVMRDIVANEIYLAMEKSETSKSQFA